jgi:hypothetical protein
MKDFKLTHDGDFDFNAGGTKNIQLLTDEDEIIAQRIRIALRSFKNDWFLALDDGLPWLQDILTKQGTLRAKQALIKNKVLNVEGVRSLAKIDFEYDNNNRILSVDLIAISKNGEIPVTIDNLLG